MSTVTSQTAAGAGASHDRAPVPAVLLPDGTPHPDPVLAAKGWQVQGGVYVRITGSITVNCKDFAGRGAA